MCRTGCAVAEIQISRWYKAHSSKPCKCVFVDSREPVAWFTIKILQVYAAQHCVRYLRFQHQFVDAPIQKRPLMSQQLFCQLSRLIYMQKSYARSLENKRTCERYNPDMTVAIADLTECHVRHCQVDGICRNVRLRVTTHYFIYICN